MNTLYAWWKSPINGTPEVNCPVKFHAIQVVPGMGQWVLVHLMNDTLPDDLPAGVIAASDVSGWLSSVVSSRP